MYEFLISAINRVLCYKSDPNPAQNNSVAIFKCDECLNEFGPGDGARVPDFGKYCAECLDAILDQLDVEVPHMASVAGTRAPVTAAREEDTVAVALAPTAPPTDASPPESLGSLSIDLDVLVNSIAEVRYMDPVAGTRAPVTAVREEDTVAVALAPTAPPTNASPPESLRSMSIDLDVLVNPIAEAFKCEECQRECAPGDGARLLDYGIFCMVCLETIKDQLLDTEVRHMAPVTGRRPPVTAAREEAAMAVALAPTAPLSKPSPPESLRQLRIDLEAMINPISEMFKCEECQRECVPGEGARVLDYGVFCIVCLDAIKEQLDAEDENEQEWQMVSDARTTDATETGFRRNQLNELIELEELELVPNTEEFTCGVCLTECEPGEGVLLRECLHTYCRDCLAELIRHCDDEVKCPYRAEDYACSAALRESEVRALVSAADYNRRLSKTFRLAGARMRDAFHCRTPNCAGWCVKDDEAEIFNCPLCVKTNCLQCQAIHEGKTCQEYADDQWNDQARQDIEQFMRDGTAMNCPTCDIVLMKDEGCDWVLCALCKTEICWARRMVRWGPGGLGDTSGGCRCRVGGELCHPQCNNCH